MTSALHDQKNRILSALWVCLASCGMTALLLAAVYALRGIWPFGTDNVAYMDAAQFYVPRFYTLWDDFHGSLSSGAWKDLLYPYNWPFLFVARDHVLEAMSLFLGIRLMLVAASAAIALCWRFPQAGSVWKTVFALLYTFSGFVLQYYSNFSWLTVVALFPLLLLGLEQLLREGKYVLYALLYACVLQCGVYYAYMATIYILLFSLGYCLIVLPRDKRGDRIFRLGLATAAALGICCRVWIQNAVNLSGGARFQENLDSGIETGMTTWDITNTRHTFLMLMGMALPAALMARAVLRQRTAPAPSRPDRRRAIRFFSYMLGVFLLPMVFTNIDTAWHFGQYNFFPMRYGYMLPATLIAGACLALEDECACPDASAGPGLSGRPWLLRAAGIISCAGILLLAPRLARIFREYGACFLKSLGAAGYLRYFAMYVICGALFAVLYSLLLRLNRRQAAWAVAAAALLQLGTNAWGQIAPDDSHTATHEYDPAYIEVSEQLYGYFSQQEIAPLTRVKNVDNCLNAGYPAIAGVEALSSIRSGNSSDRLDLFRNLGYTVNYFRILDTGGTVFSDMLLNVDRIISENPLDPDLYLPGDIVDGVQIGFSRYPGVLGLMYSEDALTDYFTLETIPDRLNALYGAFTDSRKPLALALEPEIQTTGEGLRAYTLTCELEAPAFLYMAANGMLMNITAGGRQITVPSYLDLSNTVYPAPFNANLLPLGLFGPGQVQIQFSCPMDLGAEDLTLVGLDKAALDSFRNDAALDRDMVLERSDGVITVTVTADQPGRRLFLPIMDPDYYTCTVNGGPVELGDFIGVMTSIPLQEGKNTVTLTAGGSLPVPAGPRILSAVCLILALLWLALRRTVPRLQGLTPPPAARMAAQVLFYAAAAVVVLFVYVLPTYHLLAHGQIIWF